MGIFISQSFIILKIYHVHFYQNCIKIKMRIILTSDLLVFFAFRGEGRHLGSTYFREMFSIFDSTTVIIKSENSLNHFLFIHTENKTF